MMLDHLGHPEASAGVVDGIARVLAESDARTPDLGGRASTAEFAAEVRSALAR